MTAPFTGTVMPVAGPYWYEPTPVIFNVAAGTVYVVPISPVPPSTVNEKVGPDFLPDLV